MKGLECPARLNTEVGRSHLARQRDIPPARLDVFRWNGLSSLANVVASIKVAERLGAGAGAIAVTIATVDAAMYASQIERMSARKSPIGVTPGEALEFETMDLERIINLGHSTWLEPQELRIATSGPDHSWESRGEQPLPARSGGGHVVAFNRRARIPA